MSEYLLKRMIRLKMPKLKKDSLNIQISDQISLHVIDILKCFPTKTRNDITKRNEPPINHKIIMIKLSEKNM